MIRCIGTSLQLQPIISAHNQWLSKTRCSLPLRLTWFRFTSQSLLQLPLSAGQHATAKHSTPLRLNRSPLHGSFYTLPVTMENVCCHGNVLTEPLPSKSLFHVCSLLWGCVFGELLFSSGSTILAFRRHVTICLSPYLRRTLVGGLWYKARYWNSDSSVHVTGSFLCNVCAQESADRFHCLLLHIAGSLDFEEVAVGVNICILSPLLKPLRSLSVAEAYAMLHVYTRRVM
jgi:hypothetical protein